MVYIMTKFNYNLIGPSYLFKIYSNRRSISTNIPDLTHRLGSGCEIRFVWFYNPLTFKKLCHQNFVLPLANFISTSIHRPIRAGPNTIYNNPNQVQIDGQVKPTNIKYESSVNCNTIFNNLSQVQTQGSMLRKSMLSNLIIVYQKTSLEGGGHSFMLIKYILQCIYWISSHLNSSKKVEHEHIWSHGLHFTALHVSSKLGKMTSPQTTKKVLKLERPVWNWQRALSLEL